MIIALGRAKNNASHPSRAGINFAKSEVNNHVCMDPECCTFIPCFKVNKCIFNTF